LSGTAQGWQAKQTLSAKMQHQHSQVGTQSNHAAEEDGQDHQRVADKCHAGNTKCISPTF
jgi:hypothetical protein